MFDPAIGAGRSEMRGVSIASSGIIRLFIWERVGMRLHASGAVAGRPHGSISQRATAIDQPAVIAA
ncbi:hypothetical protein ACYZX9_16660 [Sphingomonas citri]